MQSRIDVQRLADVYEGVPVLGSVPGSPASRAGSRYGDVIVEMNGKRVRNLDEYFDATSSSGRVLQMLVVRDGERIQLTLELDRQVDPDAAVEYATKSRAFAPVTRDEQQLPD